ncbi:MAG: AAA family ATPase [Gammaproteobacteria bacterium]|nr:AAA family ATPase [Gammaproteobacteria bacterium]MDP2348844.1 AAA family ATPase [Gammaproteobacteria bacterium]
MTDLRKDIVAWLHKQQDWLQEAAEQLIAHGELSNDSIGKLAEYLKSIEGQKISANRQYLNLKGAAPHSADLRLLSVGNVQGIENLSPRRPLCFGDGNLSVIYGHNGSGKSSYTRIFKKICGKQGAMDLKQNVFEATPSSRKCDLEFNHSGIKKSVTWSANAESIFELQSVDIFDGEAAGFYLTGESEVSYIPPAVALFEHLAGVCDRVRKFLADQQSQLVCKLPMMPVEFSTTETSRKYHSLKAEQTAEQLMPLIGWSDENQNSLDALIERLKTDDPTVLAQRKRNRKRQIDNLVRSVQAASNATSSSACAEIQVLKKSARDNRQRATEAAKVHTASAILDGIGTETWISLWEAARSYSIESAYVDQQFPVTDKEALCVLCHQSLNSDARKRLQDFESYVQGKMEADARLAESTYQKALAAIPNRNSEQEVRTQCEAAGLDEDLWLLQLNTFWKAYQCVIEEIRSSTPELIISGVDMPKLLLSKLIFLADQLEKESVQHDSDATSFNRLEAASQKLSLEAKRWTTQQAESIRNEVTRLNSYRKFEQWKSLTGTTAISRKAGDISEKAITESYVARFNNELKNLGAKHIKVELVKSGTQRGRVKHRIQLQGVVAKGTKPESILSEGERRVVALAAFLADVTGKPQTAPFIFDDPISSLDQDFEWDVAVRLARLALDRQVLVFTHRLSLYGAMEDAVKKVADQKWKERNLRQLCIESFNKTAGHPADEFIWSKSTAAANDELVKRLTVAKTFSESGDLTTYRIYAQSICSDFRKLLERTVEEDLFYKIVKRHRRSITTDNLICNVSKITPKDCSFIDNLMTKYSCYEHSQSQEAPAFLPDESELSQDLIAMKEWRDEYKKRTVETVE